ncbi:hypothetical protein [Nannocystis exedens]|uniref:hypothetical protein n=1 Tax=Nannocystis exedens TaxID=54 RepID=UPI00117C78BF|nr:hypothetical protein [Nannocystis exedens]
MLITQINNEAARCRESFRHLKALELQLAGDFQPEHPNEALALPSPFARVHAMGHREFVGPITSLGRLYRVEHHELCEAGGDWQLRVTTHDIQAVHSIEYLTPERWAAELADLEEQARRRTDRRRLFASRAAGEDDTLDHGEDDVLDARGEDDVCNHGQPHQGEDCVACGDEAEMSRQLETLGDDRTDGSEQHAGEDDDRTGESSLTPPEAEEP